MKVNIENFEKMVSKDKVSGWHEAVKMRIENDERVKKNAKSLHIQKT